MADGQRGHEDYTVAWICPLEVEQIAATAMLDDQHPRLAQPPHDHNVYTLGSIFGHNVVIAGLPTTGNTSAATVVAQMKNTFPQLRFGLLVGIGGGVPTRTEEGNIRLGDVVVSKPTGQHSGAVQYDHGKAEAGEFKRTGFLAPPPNVLLSAAMHMSVAGAMASSDPLVHHLKRIDTSKPRLRRFRYPGSDTDHLYEPDYVHSDSNASCQKCGCDPSRRVNRNISDSDEEDGGNERGEYIVVHRGTIAVGEKVMKNGVERDRLARENGVLCFEMEAAGVLNDFPCLVIRGISDYADSHKNDKWQGYAAAVAAAYARELFNHIPVDEVKQCRIAESDVRRMIRDTKDVARNSHEKRIRRWLDPPDPSTNRNSAQEKRYGGTGLWFLQSDTYRAWKAGQLRALWLQGIMGCGKTVLISTVIEDLEAIHTEPSESLLYFFFDFTDGSKQTADKMLRALIFQLYQRNEASQSHLERLFENCRDGNEQPRYQSLISTFEEMTMAANKVVIVLDALDECTTGKQLLSWLARPAMRDVHLLLSSRKEERIESSLERWVQDACVVSIQKEPVNMDIRMVVRHILREDEELLRWKAMPEVQADIEAKLMENAGGMFRWAVCQLDTFRECLDLPSLESALASLPKTLNETYERILRNIPQTYKAGAIRILQFLLFAERPLRLEEAVDALAVLPNRTPAFEERNRMPQAREIARYCSSLTTITPGPRQNEAEGGDDRENLELRLAHSSVREYLVSGQVLDEFRAEFTSLQAEEAIVNVSLAYLFTAAQVSEMRAMGNIRSRLPFIDFCARHWMAHARTVETQGVQALSWTTKLFVSPKVLRFWLLLFDSDTLWRSKLKDGQVGALPLYYASLGGLEKSVQLLLSKGADVNYQGGHYGNALQAASAKGHEAVVLLLLNSGAYVNVQSGHYSNALLAASVKGHEALVLLLIKNGAEVNPQGRMVGTGGKFFGTALQGASDRGNEAVVQMLLQNGANVNAQGGRYGNALQAASASGREAVVRLLLDNGAEVNAHGGYFGTALHAAFAGGYDAVVRMLLDNGADLNVQGGWYGSALQAASLGGHEAMVQMLIDDGIDVNAQGGHYGNALQAASARGQEAVVRLLIDNGAEVNAQGGFYGTALQAASARGYEAIARLLVEKDAEVNVQGGTCSNALQAASIEGHEAVVRLLLEKGAEANAHGGIFSNALQAASLGGHEAVVQALVEGGAVVEVQDEHTDEDELFSFVVVA